MMQYRFILVKVLLLLYPSLVVGKSYEFGKGGLCEDEEGDFWIKGLLGKQSCLIARHDKEVCELKNDYKRRCPIACNSCADSCEDTEIPFVLFGESLKCKSIKDDPDWCDNYWFSRKCPYTCNFCPGTIIPSQVPSMSPSPSSDEPDYCHDVKGTFRVKDFYTATSTCKQAKLNPNYCKKNDVFKRKCPITCDSCPICKNNKDPFKYEGSYVTCRDADTNPKMCDGYVFAKNCAFKCDFCPKPPTIPPKSKPSSPPSVFTSTPPSAFTSTPPASMTPTPTIVVSPCEDRSGAFPVDNFVNEKSTCKKAKKFPRYCNLYDEFKRFCPETCDSCPECKDVKGQFLFEGEMVRCRSANNEPKLCLEYDFAKKCSIKCKFCEETSSSPVPSTPTPSSSIPPDSVPPSVLRDEWERQERIRLEEKTGEITVLSDNSRTLILTGKDRRLTTFKKNKRDRWVEQQDFVTSYDPYAIALSSDGSIMVVSSERSAGTYYISVLTWNGNRWTEGGIYEKELSLKTVDGADNPTGLPVAMSADGKTFAIATLQGLFVYDFQTDISEWNMRNNLKVPVDPTQLAISDDGSRVVVNVAGTKDLEVYEYKASNKWALLGEAIDEKGGNEQKTVFAKSGNLLVVADWKDDSNRGAIFVYQFVKIRGVKVWKMQGEDAIVRGETPPDGLGWDVDISSDGSVLVYSQNGLVKILTWERSEWVDGDEFTNVGLRPEVELSGNGFTFAASTPLTNPINEDGSTIFRGETNVYEWV